MSSSGDKILNEANKLATKKGPLGGLFGGGPKYDEAADLYKKAANAFKMDKDFHRASDAYMKASEMHHKEGEAYQEANMLKEAGDCMKRVSGRQALPLYEKSAEILNASGKFGQSGRMFEKLAESFEHDGDIKNAMAAYLKAGELYELDEFGKTKYVANISKWADLASQESEKHYDEAISTYEKCGKRAVQNDLTQYNAKKWFTKAVVLYMVKGDTITADVNLERYGTIDPRLSDSREGKLLVNLIKCLESNDAVGFTTALGEYDSVTKLDPWHVHFFSLMKRRLDKAAGKNPDAPAAPGADSDDDDLC